MKWLRRLEDTDLYFLCDTSSNPDKEEIYLGKASQKLKILKGATDPRRDLYATLEYILCEGFDGDLGEAFTWRSCKQPEREHDNEGRKYKRDLQIKFIEDDAKDDRNHKGEKRKFDEKMEEEHKAHIAKLEARAPGMPEADKEAREQAFRLTST